MRNKYNAILSSLLRNYGIEHEAEIISTAFTKLHCRYHERNDRKDVMKVVVACFKKLVSDFMLEFIEEFTQCSDANEMDEAVLQKASAWYVVTYSDPEPKYLSFPWIVHKYLANLKMRQNQLSAQPFSPAIVKFDEKILECESENLLPNYEETHIWDSYAYLCDPLIVKRALKVLILWATEEEIIVTPERQKGLLYVDVFVKIFLYVAELCKYVTQKDVIVNDESQTYSSGKLCLEFLKFCSSLRFYNHNDIHEILPFYVYKPTKLAKRAVVAYHKFALLGLFRNLYFDQKIDDDLINMQPISIDSKIFGKNPISVSTLKKAEEALKKYSDVETIHLSDQRQTKKVCISATGSERSIKELRSILRKGRDYLTEFFKNGSVPEVSVVDIVNVMGAKQKKNPKIGMPQEAVPVVDIIVDENSSSITKSDEEISVLDIFDKIVKKRSNAADNQKYRKRVKN